MKVAGFLFLTFFIFSYLLASEGGWTSNGGDTLSTRNNPWFLEDLWIKKEISFCIQMGDFSVSSKEARMAVTKALKDWQQLLKLSEFSIKPIGSSRRRLATNFRYQSSCDSNTHLKFLFGTYDLQVEKLIKERGYPVAFAQMIEYDPQDGSGKGIIWLMPDQGDNVYQGKGIFPFWYLGALHPVIMHELGHVFGVGHQFGSFMDSHFPYQVYLHYLNYLHEVSGLDEPINQRPFYLDALDHLSSSNFLNYSAPAAGTNNGHPKICTLYELGAQNDDLDTLGLKRNKLLFSEEIFHRLLKWSFPPGYAGRFQLCLQSEVVSYFPKKEYRTVFHISSLDGVYKGKLPVTFKPNYDDQIIPLQGFYQLHKLKEFLTPLTFLKLRSHYHRGFVTHNGRKIEFSLKGYTKKSLTFAWQDRLMEYQFNSLYEHYINKKPTQ